MRANERRRIAAWKRLHQRLLHVVDRLLIRAVFQFDSGQVLDHGRHIVAAACAATLINVSGHVRIRANSAP